MNLIYNKKEIEILNTIIDIQILSYKHILEGDLLKEDEELLLQFQSSLADAENEAKWLIREYRTLKQEPAYLPLMPERQLTIMRHLLFRIEEDLTEDLDAVMKLWEKFLQIEEQQKPEITLTLKLKEYGTNKGREKRNKPFSKNKKETNA